MAYKVEIQKSKFAIISFVIILSQIKIRVYFYPVGNLLL